MVETWYVLDDGSYADPKEVRHNGKHLVSADGRKVARHASVDAYVTRGVDPETVRAAQKAKEAKSPNKDNPIDEKKAPHAVGVSRPVIQPRQVIDYKNR